MKERSEHSYRLAKPSERVIRAFTKGVREREGVFREREVYMGHRRVIEGEMIRRVYGEGVADAKTRAALAALEKIRKPWAPAVRDQPGGTLPPFFEMKPGLNIIGPPYDFTVSVALGGQTPAVMASAAAGTFAVNGTGGSGRNFQGSASVCLFIVPSDPGRLLSIRPYFEYEYSFSCESHGPPTAHTHGSVSCEVSGIKSNVPTSFPGKALSLWSGSSDAWDDDGGSDAGVFRNPDCELRVSGFDYYTVQFSCQADGDSGTNPFGYSITYVTFHCRVPFIVVEEF